MSRDHIRNVVTVIMDSDVPPHPYDLGLSRLALWDEEFVSTLHEENGWDWVMDRFLASKKRSRFLLKDSNPADEAEYGEEAGIWDNIIDEIENAE